MSAIQTLIEQQPEVRSNFLGEGSQELDRIVSRNLPMFYRMASRLLGNTADAEDAVQDALLSACKHLGQFRGEAKLSTWLAAIVTNTSRMQLRRRRGHLSLEEQWGEDGLSIAEQIPDGGPNPEEICSSARVRWRIINSVERLSPPLRRTFHLRDIEGLTNKEAALVLGVPVGTVKARLARARTKLSRIMGAKPTQKRCQSASQRDSNVGRETLQGSGHRMGKSRKYLERAIPRTGKTTAVGERQ